MKTKNLVSFILSLAMVLSLSITAFAAEANTSSETPQVLAVQPRIGPTTKPYYLSTGGYVQIYQDGNILNQKALLTNNSGNPGSVIFQVRVTDSTGFTSILDTSNATSVSSSWTSVTISNQYSYYTVYAKAVTTNDTYSITYRDI
jgi:cytoskeletal protein RodZ